mmetsp:Transcript_13750/g.16556  ORF Transcript_13750/g.16556 Transcript_13750/m.16556 type:complete len:407 (+) Transcript_13750:214-1434(+)|eukprot:CAMPEP_0197851928 /NCGR_PEP_ID=MMETSP1438-20131217/19253_1 /TAXON_ID=1461541 /ORGANISM="Pterosperma sp., Strain CCMP1384" /LENGTH=406 /DNA_ID=CAMNT_0043465731 /DNA_START=155 /DNA_END=1375 /DNA_ORIENTATION=-
MVRYAHTLLDVREVLDPALCDIEGLHASPSNQSNFPFQVPSSKHTKPLSPRPWLEYKLLKKKVNALRKELEAAGSGQSPTPGGAADGKVTEKQTLPAADEFFTLLRSSIEAIEQRFVSDAQALIQRAEKGTSKSVFSRFLGGGCISPSPRQSDNLYGVWARMLRLYSVANRVGVRKIVKKYAKINSADAKRVEEEFKQLHTEGSSDGYRPLEFMHGGLLSDLWALESRLDLVNKAQGSAEDSKFDTMLYDYSTLFDKLEVPWRRRSFDGPMSSDEEEEEEEDLVCKICFDTVHRAIGLACGHFFCERCLLRVARLPMLSSVPEADPSTKCPSCRQDGVFSQAQPLTQVDRLVQLKVGMKEWRKREEDEVAAAKTHAANVLATELNAIGSASISELRRIVSESDTIY